MTRVEYYFASTGGTRIRANREQLAKPLITSLSSTHSNLTLLDNFRAVESILLDQNSGIFKKGTTYLPAPKGKHLSPPEKLIITSEKLGAFYHISSAEWVCEGKRVKLAISSAFSKEARRCLEKDFSILSKLSDRCGATYFPRQFFLGHVERLGIPFTLDVSQWLDGYYEWHFSQPAQDKTERIILWDTGGEFRYLGTSAALKIFHDISQILTMALDAETGDQIRLWHHAAGDFIVREEHGSIRTMLTTVREYGPLVQTHRLMDNSQLIHTLYMLLDTTVRIRLDRLDGVGEPIWISETMLPGLLESVLQGFRHGCEMMADQGRLEPGIANLVLELIAGMEHEEIVDLYGPLHENYQNSPESDRALIAANMQQHIRELKHAAQSLLTSP